MTRTTLTVSAMLVIATLVGGVAAATGEVADERGVTTDEPVETYVIPGSFTPADVRENPDRVPMTPRSVALDGDLVVLRIDVPGMESALADATGDSTVERFFDVFDVTLTDGVSAAGDPKQVFLGPTSTTVARGEDATYLVIDTATIPTASYTATVAFDDDTRLLDSFTTDLTVRDRPDDHAE